MVKLCDDCLEKIYSTLSDNAIEVFELIVDDEGLTRSGIQDKVDLSYAYTGKAITELQNKLLIYKDKITSDKKREDGKKKRPYKTCHRLTKNGQVVRVIHGQSKVS